MNYPLDRRRECARVAGISNEEFPGRVERADAIGKLLIRQIHLRLTCSLEPPEAYVTDDADDRPVLLRKRKVREPKMKFSAERILIRPIPPSEGLADDSHR